MLTATVGSVIPIAIAVGSPFWLAVGIAATVAGVVVALHGAPRKASSRVAAMTPAPIRWIGEHRSMTPEISRCSFLSIGGRTLLPSRSFSDFECHVTPPYGKRSKEPGRMTGTLIVAEYDPAPFPGVPRLFSAKYK